MLISVIIPTRNRYDYLSHLLDDLINQDIESDFEIIVVDQSTEPEKLNYCNQIILNSVGPCVSRNIAVNEAKGEILVFLDDDARINDNFIREITSPITNDNFDAVAGAICNSKGEYPVETQHYFNTHSDNFIKAITKNPNSSTSRICMSFPGGCSAILRKVFIIVGGFDEQFDPTGAGEDRDMALKLYHNGYTTWYNAKAKLLHLEAGVGGSRDAGSRSMMLDIHTYIMCKKYFSNSIVEMLKLSIIKKYRKSFFKALINRKQIRTKYKLLKVMNKRLK